MTQLLQSDLLGRLRNYTLGVDKALMPLFEAVDNSIHGIEECKSGSGCITISIIRRNDQKSLDIDPPPLEPITGFVIQDDGIGFNEANFTSFCTPDSRRKVEKGGKGLGRLSWLKAFDHAAIESVFSELGITYRRQFSFTPSDNGIEEHAIEVIEFTEPSTRVELRHFKENYRDAGPKQYDTIARHIIDHFLSYFVLDNAPTIFLVDKQQRQSCCLNELFNTDMHIQTHTEQVDIEEHAFTLTHCRISTRQREPHHILHFCALRRSVEIRDLSKLIPNLRGPLEDGGNGMFLYAAYLYGPHFDSNVNQERTRLEIPHDSMLLRGPGELTWERLIPEVATRCEKFLDRYLQPVNDRKLDRVRAFAKTRPRFRPVLSLRREWISRIPSDVSDEQLEMELYKLLHQLEIDVRRNGHEVRSKITPAGTPDVSKRKMALESYLDEANQVGLSKLAEYVIHRRAVIDLLSDCAGMNAAGGYQLEDIVHDAIFPMKHTSDSVPNPDLSNLWMIDERLSYHYYLASDLQFRSTGEVAVEDSASQKRVDLLVLQPYDRPHAFVGDSTLPFNSVTIIEFKRPLRDDYSAQDAKRDPVAQVWNYTRSIREGSAKDKTGKLIKVTEGTQFYAYIICSLTASMRELAEGHDFIDMPDGMGYFKWHGNKNYRVYTEIIDYDKLIADARKRNEVFFDKLCLPQ